MRNTLFILTLAGILSACEGPLDVYYKPGVSVTRLQTDETNCEVKALKDAPVAQEIRQRPPVFYPGHPICNGYGQCWYRPGYWVDGGVYSVDVNKDLRNRVLTQCMAEKGYRPVSIPQCSSSVKAQAPVGQTTRLPTLTDTSCYIKNADDSYQIVTVQ